VVKGDVSHVFRVLLPTRNLTTSRRFYESLLATKGREVGGGRIYLDCGRVILGLLDYSSMAPSEFARATEAIYLATNDLESLFLRARKLGCLALGFLHDDPTSPLVP
jgi:hypothetical protein